MAEWTADSAESNAIRNLSAERVHHLLDQLTESQRDVVMLRMVADLSIEQVAVALDKPVTAIKALQRRGLRRLATMVMAETTDPSG